MLTILPTFTYNIIFNFGNEPKSLRSLEHDAEESCPIFLKANLFISVAFHSISIWLTVYLAGFRYHFMKKLPLKHSKSKPDSNLSRSNYTILAMIFFVNLVLNAPIFCCSSINIEYLNKTINAIVGELIPCVLLTVFISLLIRIIAKKKSSSNKIQQKRRLEIKSFNSIFNYNIERIQIYGKQNKNELKMKMENRNSLLPNWSFNSILLKNRRNSLNSNKIFLQDDLKIKSFNSMLNIEQIEGKENKKELKLEIRNKENSLFPNLSVSSFSFKTRINTKNSNQDVSKIKRTQYNSIEVISNYKGSKDTNIKSHKPRTKHTTLVLTLACFLFLLAELPQFILLLLSLIKGEWFYDNVYMLPLAGLVELITVISSSINCLIYSQMSSSYRETLFILFGVKRKSYL